MTTKNEILQLLPVEQFGDLLEKVDFENLDKFVRMLIAGFVSRRGATVVRSDIEADDSSTETSTFLSHVIEVGSLKILNDSKLITPYRNVNEAAAFAVALSMNISMATSLKAKGVYDLDIPVFFAMPPLEILVARVINHLGNASNDSSYINSLVKNYLLHKI